MSEKVRVVVVKKRPRNGIPSWSSEPVPLNRNERKAKRQELLDSGMKFYTFCWDLTKFDEFAKYCEGTGVRPNEVLWSLICKEMGWTS